MKRIYLFNKTKIPLLFSLAVLLFAAFVFRPDEGMYPLSDIRKLDLKSAGLKIDIDEVYNPNGTSLVDALVRIGGCTGSFVSEDGLILTNHHCSFGAVQRASTVENNYLENGFLAASKSDEIPASGLSCRITVSYEDVSERVLNAAENSVDINERTSLIAEEIKKIVAEEEKKDTTIRAEVSEMFVGQSYVLFRYKIINDIRLVYVPPRAIGNFGGESDNWIWPRHTGDFSFLRAYVAPDGSPAAYSEDNIPYKPKKYLKINPEGVDENDFVFLLGYPGRTYKHQPSPFLIYQQNYQLPYIQHLFEWTINQYLEKGKTNPEFALETSSLVKSLSNVEKNYRGKLQGLDRLNLVEKKQKEEEQLQSFINANPELRARYGNLLKEIRQVYEERFLNGRIPLMINLMQRLSNYIRLGMLAVQYHAENEKPVDEQNPLFKPERENSLYDMIDRLYNSLYPDLHKKIISKTIMYSLQYPEFKSLSSLNHLTKEDDIETAVVKFVDSLLANSFVNNKDELISAIKMSADEFEEMNDPFFNFCRELYQTEVKLQEQNMRIESRLNILLAQFMDAKKAWMKKTFVPDANGTLRLTYGYVQGYSPADAVYYYPITTLKGVIEKAQDEGDYQLPDIVRELYAKRDFGSFMDEELKDVPVAILYNTDTSGGNSGSPVMDAYGQLVGLNFDRSFEATVNDYVWSEQYSRSIGVDIRYILWVTEKVGGAFHLLSEMGI
ncbi:MAG: S46 family peptidase [Ignavibacteriaceae bacterium]